MSAENPSDANEVTTESDTDPADRRDNTVWAQLVTLLIGAIVLVFVLTQCVPHVPDVRGLSEKQALEVLTNAGYEVGSLSRVAMPGTPAGKVGDQAPEPGAVFAKGHTIDLVVAVGTDMVKVPDTVGTDTPAAELLITRAKLLMDTAGQYSPTIPPGAVISQEPGAGAQVPAGSEVVVVVSMGIQPETGTSWRASNSEGAGDSADTDAPDWVSAQSTCTASYPGASVWSSGGDVYIRLTDGGGTRRLTSGSGWDTAPLLSPSAKFVVFMRAPSSGSKADKIGRVCLTTFEPTIMRMPLSAHMTTEHVWYQDYAFGPSESGTGPASDWLVVSQLYEYPLPPAPDPEWPPNVRGRIAVCNVPAGSSWVAWNEQFFPIGGLSLSKSSRAGCVKVTASRTDGRQTIRDINVYSGKYLR